MAFLLKQSPNIVDQSQLSNVNPSPQTQTLVFASRACFLPGCPWRVYPNNHPSYPRWVSNCPAGQRRWVYPNYRCPVCNFAELGELSRPWRKPAGTLLQIHSARANTALKYNTLLEHSAGTQRRIMLAMHTEHSCSKYTLSLESHGIQLYELLPNIQL